MRSNQTTKLVSNLRILSDRGYEPEVKKLNANGLYEVQSFRNPSVFYVVDLIAQTCTCPQFKFRGVRCKHIKAVEAIEAESNLTDLTDWERDLRRIGLL
jgi:predicted nucleic acid-binding Zn finger protein